MMDRLHIHPTREEFLALAGQGNLVPMWADLMADMETPVSAYGKLSGHGASFLLESVEGGTNLSRYSFIGCNPRRIYEVRNGMVSTTDRNGQVTNATAPADPLSLIERELAPCRPVKIDGMPPFVGGAVGFLSYEYVSSVEPTVPHAPADPSAMPVLHFLMTDTIVAFDRVRQTMRIIVNVPVDKDPAAAYEKGASLIRGVFTQLNRPSAMQAAPVVAPGPLAVPGGNFTKAGFEDMVARSQEYIRSGDIIQIVLSQRFEKPYSRSPIDLFRALRTVNPSPYMFIYETPEFALVGASPETHVRLKGRRAEIRPIAGTRPRGADKEKDLALEKDLLADAKECAEHLMLVDLARNDFGRVCEYGSVRVPEYMVIERYSHVMHIVSQVEGDLADGRNAFDLVRATIPAGTVSGAPKVRAMQLIAGMEQDRRGPYAGVLGYFSYDGNLDSCIAIRTALVKDGKVSIQAGAGIVADSVPAAEFQETVNKASGLFRAVALSESL